MIYSQKNVMKGENLKVTVRVLQILDNMGYGGAQAFVMNVYRNIDRNEIQFDFLLHRHMDESYEEEIKEMGGKLFFLPSRRQGIIKNRIALNHFFAEHNNYIAVHNHISSLSYIQPLVSAKKHNISIRIVHAHSTRAPGNKLHTYIHKLNKRRIERIATNYLACSENALDWFYSNTNVKNKAVIVPNGIKCEKYLFNEDLRKMYREQLEINEKHVIGHVGRFEYPKNHDYLISVFYEYLKQDKDAVLILIGDGTLRKKIEDKVKKMGINKNVLFLGQRNDVENIMQAMDIFLIPSHYEGFPVVMVEAQASGLICIASDTITKSADITHTVLWASIKDNPERWIAPMKSAFKNHNRIEIGNKVEEFGYDISNVCNRLFDLYYGMVIN